MVCPLLFSIDETILLACIVLVTFGVGQNYDAVARRAKVGQKVVLYGKDAEAASGPKQKKRSDSSSNVTSKRAGAAKAARGAQPPRESTSSSRTVGTGGGGAGTSAAPGAGARGARLVASLRSELAEAKANAEALSRERNFYFQKLRDIEILMQSMTDGKVKMDSVAGVVDKVNEYLYATEEGFEIVDEDGENADACAGKDESDKKTAEKDVSVEIFAAEKPKAVEPAPAAAPTAQEVAAPSSDGGNEGGHDDVGDAPAADDNQDDNASASFA